MAGFPDLFRIYLTDEPKKLRKKLKDNKQGPHLFSRLLKTAIQGRFCEKIDLTDSPKVLLAGNPHMGNYVKNSFGEGILDFDRSLEGPYQWDIACCMISAAVGQVTPETPLPRSVFDRFLDTYRGGLLGTAAAPSPLSVLSAYRPKPYQNTTSAYLEKNQKWTKQLNKSPLPLTETPILTLCQSYLKAIQKEDLLNTYTITKMGRGYGTFGRRRFLIVLSPKQTQDDAILLEIKETREYRESRYQHFTWFNDPFSHPGQRIQAAANQYAPGLIPLQSHASWNGILYTGRQIPPFSVGVKPGLDLDQVEEVVAKIGSQLGVGLARESKDSNPILTHLDQTHHRLWEEVQHIHAELIAAWRHALDLLPK